jgi:hypothetical protein
MAYYGTVTVSIGNYTKASDHEKLRQSLEYLRTLSHADHDFDPATGTGYHRQSVAAPQHVMVASGVVWSVGWWRAGDGSWWQLVKAAQVSSFTRATADFYLRTGALDDVPTS